VRADLLALSAALAAAGDPFAVAVVVRREPASSAQVGNMAVITARGEFTGWLGGSCIRPTVIREALAALADGAPRLVSLSPDPSADRRPGVTVFPMTCHSGGSVDIYVEPILPAPRLLVFGVTPAAQALVRLGKAMGLTVEAVDPEADEATFPDADRVSHRLEAGTGSSAPAAPQGRVFAVVATHGQRDEEAVAEAMAAAPAYLGVVASRKRFARIRETLAAQGLAAEALDRVKNPAGLDIGATTPEEVALSILAEIVQRRRGADRGEGVAPVERPAQALDPVCGMMVEITGAAHTADHEGRRFYFCCAGCRQRFLAAPARYLAAPGLRGPGEP
jgi:xanthine dehydrogenase accessory factor